MKVRIKDDTVPTTLRGKEGYPSNDNGVALTVMIPGEGSYRYLKSEVEPVEPIIKV